MDIEPGMQVRIKSFEELAEEYDVDDGCIVVELPDGERGYFNQEMRKFSGEICTVGGVNQIDNEIWLEADDIDELDDFYWFVGFVEPIDGSCNEATDLDEDTLSLLVQEFLLV